MEFLFCLVKISIAGSIAFLLFLMLKPLLHKFLTPTWKRIILIIVTCLFLLPLNGLLGSFSLPNLQPELSWQQNSSHISVLPQELGTDVQPSFNLNPSQDNEQNKIAQTGQQTQSLSFMQNKTSIFHICLLVWALVVTILAVRKTILYANFRNQCWKNSTFAKDDILHALLQTQMHQLHIKKRVQLRIWNIALTPMTTGVIHHKIFIPDFAYQEEPLNFILRHELIHIKQRDLVLKLLVEVISIIHWFNPLVYLLKNEMNLACECAADEKTANQLTQEQKKTYCNTILESACQCKSMQMYATMGGGAKQMKKRFEFILDTPRIKKAAIAIALIITMILGMISVYGAGTLAKAMEVETNHFAVAVKADGLYQINLQDKIETKLDSGNDINTPLISTKGKYVAYCKQNSLYVFDLNRSSTQKLADDCISFDWDAGDNLVYSTKQGGLFKWNNPNLVPLGNPQYQYDDITCANNSLIYAKREQFETREDGTYLTDIDIYTIDSATNQETVLLEGKLSADNIPGYEMGYAPTIAGISNDKNYLYIWDRTLSGSLSADGIGFGIYDLRAKKYIVDDKCYIGGAEAQRSILQSAGNFSCNPKNPMQVALNLGGGREMYGNKAAGILFLQTGEFIPFIDQTKTSMTMQFAPDGNSIYFSATNTIYNPYLSNGLSWDDMLKAWESQDHCIYQKDGVTGNVKQLTKGYFDFAPMPLDNNTFLFIRKDQNAYYLVQSDGQTERIISQNLKMKEVYYGAYEVQQSIDYYIS